MVSEDEMRRLAFSRYLFSLGIEHSHHPQPLSAIVAGRILVTNNIRHFQRLGVDGLAIENWVV